MQDSCLMNQKQTSLEIKNPAFLHHYDVTMFKSEGTTSNALYCDHTNSLLSVRIMAYRKESHHLDQAIFVRPTKLVSKYHIRKPPFMQ